jgi:hypothetical protein
MANARMTNKQVPIQDAIIRSLERFDILCARTSQLFREAEENNKIMLERSKISGSKYVEKAVFSPGNRNLCSHTS